MLLKCQRHATALGGKELARSGETASHLGWIAVWLFSVHNLRRQGFSHKEDAVRSSFIAQRFLTRIKATGLHYENPRFEQVLAISRVFMGGTVLAVNLAHPWVPEPHNQLLIFMLLVYCVQSLGFWIWLVINPEPQLTFVKIMQTSDVVWPILLCLFGDPPNSQVFVFFLFALLTTAFRFGLYEAVLTAVASSLLLVVQQVMVAFGPKALSQLIYMPLNVSRLVLRCGFLLMTGFLLGYLAEREKELRAEIEFTNHLLSFTRVGRPLTEVVTEISVETARVFGAERIYGVVTQLNSSRLFRWDVEIGARPACQIKEIGAEEPGSDLMFAFPHTFYVQRRDAQHISVDAVDDEGRRLSASEISQLSLPIGEAKSALVVRIEVGREWNGRFVLVNGRLGRNRERELRFLQNVLRQLAPVLYSIYLFRRLRSRAGTMERARVARELHDTAIQSLISIEMQVDVLRRSANGHPQTAELERIQALLREEVLNMRELMHSMRPMEISPHQFLDFTAQLVERFRSDTGVEAQFVSELEEVTLPASACRELARVVQEGLVNVRKHSGAKSVYIRFGAQNGFWKLVIDDDGNGFPFSGRLTLTELDDLHRGPAVIKERVRAIGGDMVIESSPGHGSRLEITVPQKGYEFYG
jgi:signal transduction histidine kinase